MTAMSHICIGYFDRFHGENSIVISIDKEGCTELEEVFFQLSKGLTSFDFNELKLLDDGFRIKLTAMNDMENIGLIHISKDNYEWRVTVEKWNEFREKLVTLFQCATKGHQYLDSDSKNNKDLQVVLSWNEYPLEFWEKHRVL